MIKAFLILVPLLTLPTIAQAQIYSTSCAKTEVNKSASKAEPDYTVYADLKNKFMVAIVFDQAIIPMQIVQTTINDKYVVVGGALGKNKVLIVKFFNRSYTPDKSKDTEFAEWDDTSKNSTVQDICGNDW